MCEPNTFLRSQTEPEKREVMSHSAQLGPPFKCRLTPGTILVLLIFERCNNVIEEHWCTETGIRAHSSVVLYGSTRH
ncbi:hypothetical protein AcV7_001740 [Taiwanofungus camphoratus]|nr:hypothetical protein AcV7_001740 [Antrodia cinnamomea]